MRFHPIVWVALGLLLVFSAVLLDQQPTLAQSAESACVACHETQAKMPVREKGLWHSEHTMLDCVICHGGNPAGADQQAAHAGQVVNPLEAGESCALCHPDNAANLIAGYAALVTPKAPPTAAATPTVAVPPAGESGSCRVVATECVSPAGDEDSTPVPAPGATAAPTLAATTPVTPTLAAPAAVGAPAAGGTGGFSWMQALQFTRGPLYKTAFWFFVIGMLLRLVQALRAGWKHRVAIDKTRRGAGIGKSFLSGLLVLPFIPGLTGAFRRKPVVYAAGGLFHLGLLAVILFSKTHMSAIKSMIGFGWPVLPGAVISWLAAVGIVAMLALLVNRLVDPVLRLISGPAEWLNWLVVFLPMLTGFVLARKLWLPYEVSFTIHMLLVDILLIWIPLSRISHFVFYFFARAIHGVEFQTQRAAAR